MGDTVQAKLAAERNELSKVVAEKRRLEEVLREATERLGFEIVAVKVQLEAESKVKHKLEQYASKLTEQLDYIKGSLNATTDVRVTLGTHLQALEVKYKEAQSNLMSASAAVAELEALKTRNENEIETASDEYQEEVDDINT